jgi:cell division protein FtsL
MPRAAAAPAKAPARRPAPRRRPSAPVRKAAPARPGKRPQRRPALARAARARGVAVLDALLAGQAWIVLVGVLLAGIVFFNVDLLSVNRDIARTSEHAAAVKRENGRLRLELARLGSSERIQTAAAKRGLVLPAPGEVRYLRTNGSVDARRAAKRISEPRPEEQPLPTTPATTSPPATQQVPAAPEVAQPQPQAPPTPPATGAQGAPAPGATAAPPVAPVPQG